MLRTLAATLPLLTITLFGAAQLLTAQALAQQPADSAFSGLGSESRDPIRIDADRLDVFDRENRAVYAGNVVAVQGDTTLRCSELTIFFERQAGEAAASDEGDSINRIECVGPVTILSQDQVATGDRAVYDRQIGQMVMTGNVALSQGQNVTRGERLVYDIDRGVANIEAGASQRVRGLFVPGGAQQ
jgi:lipopolysaccharide export system protein LptA